MREVNAIQTTVNSIKKYYVETYEKTMRIHMDVDDPTRIISFHTENCSYAEGWEVIRDQKESNKTGTRIMIDSVEMLRDKKREYTEKGYAINIHSKCIGEAILST